MGLVAILSCRVILNCLQIRMGFPRQWTLHSLWNLILCPYVGYRPGPAEYFGTFTHRQSCDLLGWTLRNCGTDRSRWRTGSGVPSSRCILTQMSDWIIGNTCNAFLANQYQGRVVKANWQFRTILSVDSHDELHFCKSHWSFYPVRCRPGEGKYVYDEWLKEQPKTV